MRMSAVSGMRPASPSVGGAAAPVVECAGIDDDNVAVGGPLAVANGDPEAAGRKRLVERVGRSGKAAADVMGMIARRRVRVEERFVMRRDQRRVACTAMVGGPETVMVTRWRRGRGKGCEQVMGKRPSLDISRFSARPSDRVKSMLCIWMVPSTQGVMSTSREARTFACEGEAPMREKRALVFRAGMSRNKGLKLLRSSFVSDLPAVPVGSTLASRAADSTGGFFRKAGSILKGSRMLIVSGTPLSMYSLSSLGSALVSSLCSSNVAAKKTDGATERIRGRPRWLAHVLARLGPIPTYVYCELPRSYDPALSMLRVFFRPRDRNHRFQGPTEDVGPGSHSFLSNVPKYREVRWGVDALNAPSFPCLRGGWTANAVGSKSRALGTMASSTEPSNRAATSIVADAPCCGILQAPRSQVLPSLHRKKDTGETTDSVDEKKGRSWLSCGLLLRARRRSTHKASLAFPFLFLLGSPLVSSPSNNQLRFASPPPADETQPQRDCFAPLKIVVVSYWCLKRPLAALLRDDLT
ncbi:hypothetical protein FH972_022156 [Carpinus fangiana]|uniref:Uncharacterized protein n=1 Tax=Carpinus fangiana TaxID=176857 RepID=A0A5N6KRF1_9ROSI|nr:hypothetical protein FH972_022156 [Carpinus fangiana]